MKKFVLYPLAMLALLFAGVLAGYKFKDGIPATSDQSYFTNLEKFQQVVRYVNDNYFEAVNNDKLVEDAIRGMLQGLDPHTFYITADEMREMNEQMQGSFDGIGVEFSILEDTILVVSPLSGGPSDKLGILAGDRIVKIDDKVVAGVGITNTDVTKKLRGPKGTTVRVSIRRRGVKELQAYDIVRDKIPVYSVDFSYMPTETTGYIKVSRFAENTFKEFHDHLTKLQAAGMRDLILDLRGNPGGYMTVAQNMADDFISEGKLIVYTKGRIPESNDETRAGFYKDFEKGGLIVLIDEGSASASEIVSGAVQDQDRGLIVGTRSFGKGLVQTQKTLPDGSAVRVVISRYFTPSGRCIQKPFEHETQEQYNQEILNRFKQGEVYDPTKINFPDSLKYKTASGRIVYGGGAIMPDVFVPVDTSASSKYFTQLWLKQPWTRFAYRYVDTHPAIKAQYKNGFDFTKRFTVTDQLLQEFTAFAGQQGVPYIEKDFITSKKLIANRIKMQVGHALFGEEGTRPVIHEVDEQFKEALALMPLARELETTGHFKVDKMTEAQLKATNKNTRVFGDK